MKKQLVLFLFLFFGAYSKAQSNLNVGLTASVAYSLIQADRHSPFFPQANVENSKVYEFGCLGEWRPVKRLGLQGEFLYSFFKFQFKYSDFTNGDIIINPWESHTYNNVCEPIHIFKVPFTVCYYLKKNFYISGGIGAQSLVNKKLKNNIETFFQFGVGSKIERLNWEISVEDYFQENGIKGEIIIPDLDEPKIGYLSFSRRSIKLTLSYNLWSKQ